VIKIVKRIHAYLQVTRKCNHRCTFCSNPQFNKEYTLKEAKKQVIEFKNRGITELILTGGEPTLVNWLPDIIAFTIKKGITPKIITNGLRFYDKVFLKKIYYSGLRHVHVSFHSCKEKIFDELTQTKGHLLKTIKGIDNALRIGMVVDINSTINSLNYDHLSTNVKFFVKCFPQIKHFVYNFLDPGFADGNLRTRAGKNSWLVPKYSKIEKELKKTVEVLKKNNKTFRIERVPLCYMDGFEEFCTETRKVVKDELYTISFIERDVENEVRTVTPKQLRTKVKACNDCNLNSICAGVQQEYIDINGDEDLHPIFKNPEDIINKIKNENKINKEQLSKPVNVYQ
jgi:MoaA/NifB/PqqE/SkfB family radical SAM enzyme